MNIQKFLADKKHWLNFIPIILLVVIMIWILHDMMGSSENMEDVADKNVVKEVVVETPKTQTFTVAEPATMGNNESVAPKSTGVATVSPSELLPKDLEASEFSAKFPCGQGEISQKNFLTAGYNIGINSVASSLKNANLQLRSDPPIPRGDVGPWNQSTILPDTNRKQFEIGSSV